MLNDSLILILTDQNNDDICDFVKNTGICLAASTNDVVIINTSNSLSIKEYIIDYTSNNNKRWYFIRKYNGYYSVNPLFLLPFRRFKFISRLNLNINLIFVILLLRFKRTKRYQKQIFWIFFPEFGYLTSFFKHLNFHVHFDIVDFFTFSGSTKFNKYSKEKENLLKEADTVSAISKTLKKRYQQIYNRQIKIVPQGFSIDKFLNYKKIKFENKKPIIGFVGAINSRIMINLMIELAKKNPEFIFLFIGPKQDDENIISKNNFYFKINKLFSLENVSWIDSVPKKYIASLINVFDVAIIPYDLQYEFNKFCFPMKFFEYLYMNKAIISTPIYELKRYKEFVFLAERFEDWNMLLNNILNNDKQKTCNKNCRKIALENTWEKKINAISLLF